MAIIHYNKNSKIGKIIENQKKGLCPFCNKEVDINDFYDLLSLNEYAISGLCQYCQDSVFGKT
jgi:hypothetical protein